MSGADANEAMAGDAPPCAWVQAVLARPRIPALTPEWHEARKTCLTATMAAKALGLHPYSKPEELFEELAGGEGRAFASFVANAMEHGRQNEDKAATAFEASTGLRLSDEKDVGLLTHPALPWLRATPDRLLRDVERTVLEIKCPYTGVIERNCRSDYFVQLQVQMAVCGATMGYLAQYRPVALPPTVKGVARPAELVVVRVPFMAEWFARALVPLQSFWDAVVQERAWRAAGNAPRPYRPSEAVRNWKTSFFYADLKTRGLAGLLHPMRRAPLFDKVRRAPRSGNPGPPPYE